MSSKYPFLFGLSRFGDCLNDEWFIIHLLYRISIHCPDAIIAVSDNDGEVLLIETALALPDWLDPSNSDNRVYIFQGQLHIIPLPTSPADIFTFMANGGGSAATKHALKTQDALDLLRQPGDMIKTVASDDIQCILNDRLKKSHDHDIHHTRTILANAQVAYVLLSAPQLLPLAVDAFYLRDPESLKTCATMRQFPPNNNSTDMILPWTRTTFAQTLHQQFYAPKPFRHLPSKQDESFQAADLGMKLMCGLEMLYAKKEDEADPVEQEELGNDQVDTYDLLEMAPTSLNGRTSKQTIDGLLEQYTPARLEDLVNKLGQCKEDAMDWMNVYPDELDVLLSQKTDHDNTATQHNENGDSTVVGENSSSGGDDLPPVNLEDMMAKFERFLEHDSSGVEGVNLPGEEDDDDDDDEDDDDDDEDDDVTGPHNGYDDAVEDVNKQISFDFTSFMDILNQGIPGSSQAPPSRNKDDTLDLEAFMNEMDREIASHEKIGGSFVRNPANSGTATTTTNEDEEDEAAPVDVQLNLIQNVLESFKGQQGLPGPAGNLLRQFNIALPVDKDDDDDE
ncbi:unnamed protein product [Absidia cylindrospora]